MTGQEKAAILLGQLGPRVLQAVLTRLKPEAVARLRALLDQLGRNPAAPEQVEQVMRELEVAVQSADVTATPPAQAPQLPEPSQPSSPDQPAPPAAEAPAPAETEVDPDAFRDPLGALARVPGERVARGLEGENARTVTAVLHYLDAERAGAVFKHLAPELRREVSVLLGTTAPPPEPVARRIAAAVLHRCRALGKGPAEVRADARYKKMAEILRSLDKEERLEVLAAVEERDGAAAAAVKEHMYVFEDLLLLDNRSIQKVLAEIDGKSLGVSLKGATEEIQAKVMANLSQRARQALADEMELLTQVAPSQVQQAQKAVADTIQRLDLAGEIVLMR